MDIVASLLVIVLIGVMVWLGLQIRGLHADVIPLLRSPLARSIAGL